jgi:predicted HTH domain antitoxin
MSKSISMEIPDELLELLGSEDEAAKEAKQSLVLDLVRRGRISRSKAADLLEIDLWEMPAFLSEYKIPWFDYSKKQMEQDMATLRRFDKKESA